MQGSVALSWCLVYFDVFKPFSFGEGLGRGTPYSIIYGINRTNFSYSGSYKHHQAVTTGTWPVDVSPEWRLL